MEDEIEQRIEYEKINVDNSVVYKKYRKINTTFMTNFNKGKDITQDNSNLKYNQLNTIDKYGLFYFYNESGIYFIDNSNLKILKKIENKDLSFTDLFFLKCENIFNVFTLTVQSGKIYLIICTKNPKGYSFLIYISLEKLIEKINVQEKIYDTKKIKDIEEKEALFSKGYFTRGIDELEQNVELNEEGIYEEKPEKKKLTVEEKKEIFNEEKNEELRKRNETFEKQYQNADKYEIDKLVYLDENFEEIIILDYDNYVVRYNNGDIIFYVNYNRKRILEKGAKKMSYNKDKNIFLILNKEAIYIFKERNNFETMEEKRIIPLKNILSNSIEKEKIIHIESIYNFIILYSIENSEEPKNDDKLYFLKMNSNMDEVIKIYLEKNYFYPDYVELEGIAYDSHLKRSVFTLYDKEINVYFVINKHMDLLDKYYGFKKVNDDIYDLISFELNDDEKLNSCIPNLDKFPDNENIQKLETNPFIGISIIKFKFDSYNEDKVHIGTADSIAPYLILVFGYNGGCKMCYIVNEAQERGNITEYKLKEQTNDFRKTDNISNKSLQIKINEEKAEVEKESFLYHYKKKESLIEILNRKKLNLRNIFLHDLDLRIKEHLEKINKSAYADKIRMDLFKLGEISKNKIFEEMKMNIKDLIKNAEELFENEELNQLFIKQNKEITEKNKNLEINIKNEIKKLEEEKNKFKELFLNINSPINLILTHQKIKNFFGENEVNNMIHFYNEIKSNMNILQNHTNLIEKINEINRDLINEIEICKKNYIKKKEYDCLKKRKDFDDVKKRVQNNIFIMYMKTFYNYFWNLFQFKEKEMTDELNNLNELRNKYYLMNNLGINDNQFEEEKNEDNIISNNIDTNKKRRKKFVLKEEEDIDESNNIININNISNMSKSSYNKEQRLVLANDIINNNINKETIIEREKDAIVNKLFDTNLVKEKEFNQRNKLSEILSNFEGRVTLYDESNDEECIDSNELFSDELKDDEAKQLEEKILKAKKEKAKKEKDKKIKYIKKSLDENSKEREKIEEEMKKMEDEKKAEIIEKERQIKELKNLLEQITKKFEENRQEREKEKKIYKEEMEQNINEGQKKIIEEKNKNEEKVKKMEKEIQDIKNKLLQEQQKNKEIEEKNKKLEEEKNIRENNNNVNNNLNINLNNINNLNDNQNQNVFLRNEPQKKEDEKKEEEDNRQQKFFEDVGAAQTVNKMDLFTSNKNENNNEQDNNEFKDLFKTTKSSNTNNLFSTLGQKQSKGIFNLDNNSNNQNQNQNQIRPKNESNLNANKNIFNQQQNKLDIPLNNSLSFINNSSFLNISNKGNNPEQGNSLFGNLRGFGQHPSISQANEGNKNTNLNINPISLSFGNNQNNQIQSSPFLAFNNTGGLFSSNNNQNNGNQNQDSYFN